MVLHLKVWESRSPPNLVRNATSQNDLKFPTHIAWRPRTKRAQVAKAVAQKLHSTSTHVPVLVMHGEDDQIVPIADSALLAIKLLKHGTLKTYPGLPHGMCTTQADIINPDLLAFIQG